MYTYIYIYNIRYQAACHFLGSKFESPIPWYRLLRMARMWRTSLDCWDCCWMFPTAMITVSWNLDEEKSLRRTVVERAWHSNTNSLWEDGQTGHDQSFFCTYDAAATTTCSRYMSTARNNTSITIKL